MEVNRFGANSCSSCVKPFNTSERHDVTIDRIAIETPPAWWAAKKPMNTDEHPQCSPKIGEHRRNPHVSKWSGIAWNGYWALEKLEKHIDAYSLAKALKNASLFVLAESGLG